MIGSYSMVRWRVEALLSLEGWFGGGQIGYNWQRGRLVFGMKAIFRAQT